MSADDRDELLDDEQLAALLPEHVRRQSALIERAELAGLL